MIKFFTWHDIEVFLKEHQSSWPDSWNDVKVYTDEVVIYSSIADNDHEADQSYLKEIFTKNYDRNENRILIDFTQSYLDVVFEWEEGGSKRNLLFTPLFKDIYYRDIKSGPESDKLPGARILAFHSYKGGVGRTLSLISLLRECSAKYDNKKILVIDADLEAPGLTWMLEKEQNGYVSYLDVLSVMHFENITDEIIKNLVELIKVSTITVATDKKNVEQYFLPVYREEKQVMDIFSSPEKILLTQDNKFYITETISRLGAALGADFVLVDLRAGITEHSAPYLFDPRVEKYYVTSTSMQSVKGMNQILLQIYGKTDADLLNSKVLLNMIPTTMEEERKQRIEDQVFKNIEMQFDTETSTFSRDSYIVKIPFEDSLIHIGDFGSLCRELQGRRLSGFMGVIADELFVKEEKSEGFKEQEVREILQKINKIASEEITAEGSISTNMLATSSIKELAKNFKTTLPRIVVQGAKGSGKTYIYKQLLSARTWDSFVHLVEGNKGNVMEDVYIMPLIASINLKSKNMLDECVSLAGRELGGFDMKPSFVNDSFNELQKYSEFGNATQSQWMEKWVEIMCNPFGHKFKSLSEIDQYLEDKNKRIIYIIDGLEDLFMEAQNEKNDNWKYAVRGVCQYIVNELDNLDYGNIGIIVFARKDMMVEAIETNYEQFKNLYLKYELNWSQTEALRLALWLAAKAYKKFGEGIDIRSASREVIVDKLIKLWGLKLGKDNSREAFSELWIIAALSDFKGQLQARDIVRFLIYATKGYNEMKIIYNDRLIMPIDIRKAIEPCSDAKLNEIKVEMRAIHSILKKFSDKAQEDKLLPIAFDKIELTVEEITRLEAQGYLKIYDNKYYLPEIIRLALGFKYEKGARPKVLSLLVQ